MNLRTMSTRDRRALAIGAAAFVPMLLWLLVIAPFARQLDVARTQLDRSRDLLRRELRIVASAAQYAAASTEAAQRVADAQRHMIYATSDVSAGATLAAFLDTQARTSGVEVSAIEATHDSAGSGALRRVSVRLSGTGDLEGILTLIGTLEGGTPFLALGELTIEHGGPDPITEPAPPATSDSVPPAPPRATPEVLAFRLVVTGVRTAAEPARPTRSPVNRVASR
jgi:hypothetical protein